MELLRLLWFACTEQPWWTPIGWVGGHELEPLIQGGEYFVPAVEKEMSPLTFCTPLHTGRLVCLFFNPSIYESMIMKIVHICVQYVLIVCLNVLSTLFSYFSLTSKKKNSIRMSWSFYATENDFRVFFCIMLIKLFLVSSCAQISITLIKGNSD